MEKPRRKKLSARSLKEILEKRRDIAKEINEFDRAHGFKHTNAKDWFSNESLFVLRLASHAIGKNITRKEYMELWDHREKLLKELEVIK